MKKILGILLSFLVGVMVQAAPDSRFVEVTALNPNIVVEARYATSWNFLGRKVDGYEANNCYLAQPAAEALAKVQAHVETLGFSLLVFDCYRPQRAVTDFYNWSLDFKDTPMKNIFYPENDKSTLFSAGYIAKRSGHSRGSTVDLTLVRKALPRPEVNDLGLRYQESVTDCRKVVINKTQPQLDMGTTFDCFSVLSNTANPKISDLAERNRRILKEAMEKFGFENYSKEWWHFTLKNEPFKDQYFDFIVR